MNTYNEEQAEAIVKDRKDRMTQSLHNSLDKTKQEVVEIYKDILPKMKKLKELGYNSAFFMNKEGNVMESFYHFIIRDDTEDISMNKEKVLKDRENSFDLFKCINGVFAMAGIFINHLYLIDPITQKGCHMVKNRELLLSAVESHPPTEL